MPDTSPTPAVVVDDRRFCRLKTLTYLSLGLNALILLIFIGGAICRHHERERARHEGGKWRNFRSREEGGRDFHRGFQRFEGRFEQGGRPGWGGRPERLGGFQGRGPSGMGFRSGGFGGQGPMGGGPGMDKGMGGPGAGFGGPRGMMGGPGGMAPDPAKMTDGILAMLTQKLTLTDDQQAKLKPIIQEQVTQMQKDMEAQRDAMKKKIEDAKAKIKPILNADQQKQLDALQMPGQKAAAPDAAKTDKK